jgi:hypothetical protein
MGAVATPARSMTATASLAWRRFEPCHAVTYFAPEARAAFEDAGLRGFWRGYFAGRMAPFGAIRPEPATAVCFVFDPAMVARALPDIWQRCSPTDALTARLEGSARALRRAFEGLDPDSVDRAADLARRVAEVGDLAGRPLYAANRGLPWPDDQYARLWQAATLLREHRGDGHVHVLAAADLGPCDALVLHAATGVPEPVHLRDNRGWSGEAWAAAEARLAARGWLAADGTLTEAGTQARLEIEAHTDELAAAPYARVGASTCDELLRALEPLAARVADREIVPYPNPMGVPQP